MIEDWLKAADDDTYDQIIAAIRILATVGPGLGRPLVDTIVGSRHNNMKELRPGSSGRSEVRILFAFDPKRHAIMRSEESRVGKACVSTCRSRWSQCH